MLGKPEIRLFSEMMATPSPFTPLPLPKFAKKRVEFDMVLA